MVEHVLSRWQEREPGKGWMIEVTGPGRSGRTSVLSEVGEHVPGHLALDATGKSAEQLIEETYEHFGLDPDVRHPKGWIGHLLTAVPSDRRRTLALVHNCHRAGSTRSSVQGGHVVDHVVGGLSRAGLCVLVESMPPSGRSVFGRTTFRLPAPAPVPAPTDRDVPAAIRALALAEFREVPVQAWAMLAEGTGAADTSEATLMRLVDAYGDRLVSGPSGIAFREESFAEALRSATDPETMTRVNRHVAAGLRARADAFRHAQGWAASGPLGRYAAHSLAMHCAQGGTFGDLLGDGASLANIGQRELLDAACLAQQGSVGTDTAAADAYFLWDCGLEPGDQPQWAAWLHLTHTARGNTGAVHGIENSGIDLPWRTRWARWRPPGTVFSRLAEPGNTDTLFAVRHQDRPALLSTGRGDRRTAHIWHSGTGELLAGPWQGAIPDDVSPHLAWPVDAEGNRLSRDRVESSRPPAEGTALFPAALAADDFTALAGPGGLVAVDRIARTGPATLDGHSLIGPFGRVRSRTTGPVALAEYSELRDHFGDNVLQRLPDSALPDGLTHQATRTTLTATGLPHIDRFGFRLAALHEGIEEIRWPEDPELPDYAIGSYKSAQLIIDGQDGRVLALAPDDEDGEPVASSLAHFVTMLLCLHRGVRLLATHSSDQDAHLLRVRTDDLLAAVDQKGAQYDGWTHDLYGSSTGYDYT
ncbi:SUKH-4 family immunity protein [Streptomyces sp. NPDC050738]|uniref:SUKH-4 family immunity protein n=1 Tax=Streptomyces sp. NPDC050738 TaxID=3154744 RepID=UPI0034171D43